MRITVMNPISGVMQNLEVDENESIENIKALIEAELNILTQNQVLIFSNRELSNNNFSLKSYGLKNEDLIIVQERLPIRQNQITNPFGQSIQDPFLAEAQKIKAHYQQNPNDLNQILHQNPEFASLILANDIKPLVEYVRKKKAQEMQASLQNLLKQNQIMNDPMNPEYQKYIEEQIRQKQIDENLELAQEYMPESFGRVTMLYIECSINKHPLQAFVDSGAQSTIMSKSCAERCGILRLVDKRFAGYAVGVGKSRILGRIHAFLTCSITVMEEDRVDFLFGLDMLKKHLCSIDLKRNRLIFGDVNIEIPFLSEGEIQERIKVEELMEDQEIGNEQKIQNKKEEAKTQENQNKIGTNSQSKNNPQRIGSTWPEESITLLTNLGFSRNESIRALSVTGGNTELAASLLFQNKS